MEVSVGVDMAGGRRQKEDYMLQASRNEPRILTGEGLNVGPVLCLLLLGQPD